MTQTIYFDDAIPCFAGIAQQELGFEKLNQSFLLRDVSGKLTLIVNAEIVDSDERARLSKMVEEVLGKYVDTGGFAVSTADELFDERLKQPDHLLSLEFDEAAFKGTVKVLDRRMVGADWLRTPAAIADKPPRIVFASIKGGVGRSTALCVLAAELADEGHRVLAIDMDLEAPGLGNMLLPGRTLPRFGLLDYHVERGLGDVSDAFVTDMVASSWLGRGGGQVDVVPAIGEASLEHPANVLGKLARAYLSGIGASGNEDGFADHMSSVVERLTSVRRYDVVLIDARAGLHETTASAIVGLGAEVLLFGLNQPQTYAGYDFLFAHLATLPAPAIDDWRTRFRFVQAKAPVETVSHAEFAEKVERIVSDRLGTKADPLVKDVDVGALADEFEVVWDKSTAIDLSAVDMINRPPIVIFDDARFNSFDPLRDRSVLQRDLYGATYGGFINECRAIVDKAQNEEGS